ncbi:MAG: helix-turn-helix domain-containing protein [bacterium]|nr:helix-turn-helix domain-containing protein [bacterium]
MRKSLVSDTIPWREAFPEMTPEQEPGIVLRGMRYMEGFTQGELSKMTGIARRHISEMENAKRTIGKENAKKLAKALNTDYRLFL